MHRSVCIAFVAALLASGCGDGASQPAASAAEKAKPAEASPAEPEAKPAEPAAKTAEAKPVEPAKKAEPLTAEEQELIDANPADLTPELRRKRAFALRKKIMQNPDSETAKALEDMRRKVESGEITPELPPNLTLSAPVPSGHPPSTIPEDGAKKPTEPAPSPAG